MFSVDKGTTLNLIGHYTHQAMNRAKQVYTDMKSNESGSGYPSPENPDHFRAGLIDELRELGDYPEIAECIKMVDAADWRIEEGLRKFRRDFYNWRTINIPPEDPEKLKAEFPSLFNPDQ